MISKQNNKIIRKTAVAVLVCVFCIFTMHDQVRAMNFERQTIQSFIDPDSVGRLLRPGKPMSQSTDFMPDFDIDELRVDKDAYGSLNTEYALKRSLDIVGAIVGVLVLIPIYCVVAPIIKLTSPGPVFFKQTRIGQWGRPFMIYKFRTMELTEGNGESLRDVKQQSEVTKIGWFLRKSHIDELPNSINILKGQMSLIGPRPAQPHQIYAIKNKLDEKDKKEQVVDYTYEELVSLKPGLTTINTEIMNWYDFRIKDIYKRNKQDGKALFQDFINLKYIFYSSDVHYARYATFLSDVEIIVKSILYVLEKIAIQFMKIPNALFQKLLGVIGFNEVYERDLERLIGDVVIEDESTEDDRGGLPVKNEPDVPTDQVLPVGYYSAA